ncbi:hypothetical protein [Sporosarcina sp. G11-34]|uniref:hypothetical protein n=1 Tax=Sporosarcina sp. G11-34 TaxID=2849605 RepID=UPI0022A93BE7|nr:hypothetical protein [Sporosarcina sp. G11-34]MCZ2260501.1 hypothetical protein [Sporosarcina sp. G11-34]
MALGFLQVLIIILIIAAVISQKLLYKPKNASGNSIFIINMLFGILLSYIAFTAIPTNYTGKRVLAIGWGVVAVLAVILKLTNQKLITLSRVLLSIAIIGSLAQILL